MLKKLILLLIFSLNLSILPVRPQRRKQPDVPAVIDISAQLEQARVQQEAQARSATRQQCYCGLATGQWADVGIVTPEECYAACNKPDQVTSYKFGNQHYDIK